LIALLLLNAFLLTACATRDQLAAVPTPTPGEMDMNYAQPTAQPPDAMGGEVAMPAPPPEAPLATPTPAPEVVMKSAPPSIPSPEPTSTPVPTPAGARHRYIVRPGDSLWDISGRPPILGDRFRWPLLFKANRAAIKDPDMIWPGLELTWKESYSMPEIEEAIQKSKDTPKFVPHLGVRKQLPIQY
jgi:hypothetical protein